MLKNHRLSTLQRTASKSTTTKIDTNTSLAEKEELVADEEAILSLKHNYTEHASAQKRVSKSKMYTDFFKRKTTRAAIWRTLPPLSMEEMNLNQKADAVTEKIATGFISWLKDLGGEEEVSLSVEKVIEMFEIHTDSATCLQTNLKKLLSAPKRVAEAQNEREKAKRSVQCKGIMRGARAKKNAAPYTALKTHPPRDVQVRPGNENYYRKGIINDATPEKLASMAAVWQGITHLTSTKAFCKFLIEKLEIRPPKYLSDLGMLDWKTLKEEERSSGDMSNLPRGLDESI